MQFLISYIFMKQTVLNKKNLSITTSRKNTDLIIKTFSKKLVVLKSQNILIFPPDKNGI